jgi:hypothetical protein
MLVEDLKLKQHDDEASPDPPFGHVRYYSMDLKYHRKSSEFCLAFSSDGKQVSSLEA